MLFDARNCYVIVGRKKKATDILAKSLEDVKKLNWSKYQIKESDLRIKTANFTSDFDVDLTTGVYVVKIISPYHENFAGIILKNEYDEKTDLHTYQCQDFSRTYINRTEMVLRGKSNIYRILKSLLTQNQLAIGAKLTEKAKNKYQKYWSGLKGITWYEQSQYGNIIKANPMKNKPKMVIRDKPMIEIIRDLTYGTMSYVDVWFSDDGLLNITPLARDDWYNTGLVLTNDETLSRKFTFDTTNVITAVMINGENDKIGTPAKSQDLIKLKLSSFFGNVGTSISKENKSSSGSSKSKSTGKNNKNTTSSSAGKNGNPFNNKSKKIIVSADRGGNSGFKNAIVKKLKADGWSVTDLGIGSDQHSASYRMLSSKYAVNLVIYNGMCAGTIKECYDGWLKGKHEKYGVTLVNMWDTSHWTSKKGKHNKKGDWYHRNGDMSDYYLATAWDWNRGSSPVIKDVEAYFKKYKVVYCCGTTPANAYKQFLAGGYAKMKGLY